MHTKRINPTGLQQQQQPGEQQPLRGNWEHMGRGVMGATMEFMDKLLNKSTIELIDKFLDKLTTGPQAKEEP